MGKSYGMAKGLGGSQHVYYKNYFTNGITGGMATVATGIAFALKEDKGDAISVVDFGDGAMNEGYVMESFNMAAEMKLPVLYILENNGYAMSTPVETANPFVVFEDRVKGFGLPYSRIEASDFDQLYEVLAKAVKAVRETREPQFVEVLTHRFCGHSKSDKRLYIPVSRDEYWHEHDCMKSVAKQLTEAEVKEIEETVANEIERVYQFCVNN
jgi:TPP-dependent pyruvate/acetoin dehydrogenase alpha subunit